MADSFTQTFPGTRGGASLMMFRVLLPRATGCPGVQSATATVVTGDGQGVARSSGPAVPFE